MLSGQVSRQLWRLVFVPLLPKTLSFLYSECSECDKVNRLHWNSFGVPAVKILLEVNCPECWAVAWQLRECHPGCCVTVLVITKQGALISFSYDGSLATYSQMSHADPVFELSHCEHLYSFCFFFFSRKQCRYSWYLQVWKRISCLVTWPEGNQRQRVLLFVATCVHTNLFLKSVSYFVCPTCQSGKGKTGSHSSVLLVSTVKCI